MQGKYKAFINENLPNGRMISESKTLYREANPNSVVYFNASIVTTDGKVWWGDLDVTKDAEALKKVASEVGQTLFVLRESDGWFEGNNVNQLELIKKAVWDTTQETPFK